MSGFSADWLALREPYDRQARNTDILDAVKRTVTPHSSLTIVDLACGTGSTLRTLAPLLPARQHWRLADNNLGLLARAADTKRPERVTVSTALTDLARDLEGALDGPVDLVTTSALLDLVSAPWLERLVVEIAARRLPIYAALSYDGRIAFEPSDPLDDALVAAVNAHQTGDKGFGPALGPAAAAAAISQFEALGYEVTRGLADWAFGPHDHEIQGELLAGWALAAQELKELPTVRTAEWLQRRRRLITAGRSSLRVGHLDFVARPPAPR